MALTIAAIEARIKEYEQAIANAVANHTGLMTALNELKYLLTTASDIAEVVAPEASGVIEDVEKVVDAVDSAVS